MELASKYDPQAVESIACYLYSCRSSALYEYQCEVVGPLCDVGCLSRIL